MFLDFWYKYLAYIEMFNGWYDQESASTYYSQSKITVPQYRRTDGSYATTFNRKYSSYNPQASYAYAAPVKKILSQTADYGELSHNYGGVNYGSNIIVGNGTTPVQANDYMVESEIVSGLEVVSVFASRNVEKGTLTHVKTMRNSGDREITITEFGRTISVYDGSNNKQVLVYREVLDEPIVVAPGESFTVSISYQFTMPG